MLKVFASNSYLALFNKLDEELFGSHSDAPFRYPTLVTGTKYIAEKLKRDIANTKGVCAGIEFQSQQVWQARTMGTARQSGAEAYRLVWAILLALSQTDFIKSYSSIQKFLENVDPLAKFQLAQRIADTFSDYLRYRPEWMRAWLEGEDPVGLPDSDWQMALWRKVNEFNKNLGKYLQAPIYEDNLKNMPSPLHFFIPVSIEPTSIESLKIAATKYEKKVTVYLYSPIGHCDSVDPFVQNYATRARDIIFAFETGANSVKVEFIECSNVASNLLKSIQKAIWSGSTNYLPKSLNKNDESLRIVCSSSHTREIENAVDIIHHWTNKKEKGDRAAKAEDILVVSPNIKKLAPAIHSVLRSLPENQAISYQIVGETDSNAILASSAFLSLGDLLTGRCTIDEFEAWLELPAVSESFGLTLSDLEVLRDWLVSAGFMFGINDRHLSILGFGDGSEHESVRDATLSRAIERLVLGTVTDDEIELIDETMPVRNGKTFRFQTVESRKDLLAALLKIYDLFDSLLCEMPGSPAQPKLWHLFSLKLLERLFAQTNRLTDATSIQTALRNLSNSFNDLEIKPSLHFEVYWKALASLLNEPAQGKSTEGRVTFANMGTMRSLPYKVIIALGLDEDSSYPGKQTHHEFHLIGKRKTSPKSGDPDMRLDNQSIFLDLLSSTGSALILSYVGNKGKNRADPSSPVEDLCSFANSHTGEAPANWIESLEAEVGQNNLSVSNFLDDDSKKRYWKTGNSAALNAVKQYLENFHTEPYLIEGGVKTERGKILTFQELMAFYKDPETWAERILGLKVIEEEASQIPDFFGNQDHLSKHLFFHEVFKRLQKGWSESDLLRLASADPANGARAVRLSYRQPEIETIAKASELYSFLINNRYEANKSIPCRRKTIICTHFNEFRVDAPELFKRKGKEEFELFTICRNDSSIDRMRFLQCAIAYADDQCRPKLVVLCPQKVKAPHSYKFTEIDDVVPMGDWKLVQYSLSYRASEVIHELIDCYEKAISDVTFMVGQDKSFITGEFRPAKLWRGRDWESALKTRKAWEERLKALINEDCTTKKYKTIKASKKVAK